MSSNLYSRAGVNQANADDLAGWIGRFARPKAGSGVVSGIGGFAGLMEMPGHKGTLLVGCTDGVGTKLKLGFELKRHDTVGIDLVAMSVNDLVTTGARPLFFLDYLAVGKLKTDVAKDVLRGIMEGCRQAGCVLLGGETAQLPDFYQPGEYDLAGFAVGTIERKRLIDGSRVKPGDVLLGLSSSGAHSNGFSLVRSILKRRGASLTKRNPLLGETLGEALIRPTRIYVPEVMRLMDSAAARKGVKAIAHITGGGIPGNVPRVLPKGMGAVIDRASWRPGPVFDLLEEWGHVSRNEMFDVFNMGIGLVLVIDAKAEPAVRKALGTEAVTIGKVVKGSNVVKWAD